MQQNRFISDVHTYELWENRFSRFSRSRKISIRYFFFSHPTTSSPWRRRSRALTAVHCTCRTVHEHDESQWGGGGKRCVFGAGWRVGRAWRCVYHGFPGVEGGQRRFRERIESGRGRAHCICGMTFVVLSLTTCDAVRWSLLPPPPSSSLLFVHYSHHSSLPDCRGGRSCQSVDSCLPARRRTPVQCREGHVLRENSPSPSSARRL